MMTAGVSRLKARATMCIALALLGTSCGTDGALDPNNELPFGWMDTPLAGAVVAQGTTLAVGGWALDDSSVKEVRIYLDGRFKARAEFGTPRPDLAGKYAQYLHNADKHGWKADVAVPASPGPHTLVAQAMDDRGATHDITTISITVQ